MAKEADHISLANRNHDALLHLIDDSSRFTEWIATIAFYKAIHVVEAVFASRSDWHSSSHFAREKCLKKGAYQGIWKNYYHLLNASKIARYLADSSGSFSQFSDFMSADDVKKKLVAKRLYGVEQHALAFLSKDSRSGLKKINPVEL